VLPDRSPGPNQRPSRAVTGGVGLTQVGLFARRLSRKSFLLMKCDARALSTRAARN